MKSSDFIECESCTCFSARKTARLLTQHYDKYLRPSGLRATQFTLLVALIRIERPVPVTVVSDLLGLERTTLTRNLQHLEAKGYIQLESGSDRRVRLISITSQGAAAAKKAFPFWQNAQDLVAAHLSPATLKGFAMTASAIK
jgi:DNA-binding MarR family transcriptional regulator